MLSAIPDSDYLTGRIKQREEIQYKDAFSQYYAVSFKCKTELFEFKLRILHMYRTKYEATFKVALLNLSVSMYLIKMFFEVQGKISIKQQKLQSMQHYRLYDSDVIPSLVHPASNPLSTPVP